MSYKLPANYDNWLEKPYQDMYASETTTNIVCSEFHEDEETWECDYDGEADAYITSEEKGRRYWSVTMEGECPKCGASFTKTEGDYDDWDENERW